MSRKRVCVVATVPFAIKVFMAPHIRKLSKDYDVTLIANGVPDELVELLGENVSFVSIKIERQIALKQDLLTLIALWKIFRKRSFHCVHSITPKAGLLSMIGARFARVPIRLHTFTGQVWANKTGVSRVLLKFLDKILAWSATHVLADSHSQCSFILKNNITHENKITVLADGSIAGVNLNRFKLAPNARQQIRDQNNIPNDAVVFLYLGRLKKDKGVMDLVNGFSRVAKDNLKIHLLIVGPDEEYLENEITQLAVNFPEQVHRADYTKMPERYMSAADVFCLPSYREGFGSVLIESASVGLPAIASRIYGITDAVEEGVSGILHEPGAIDEISTAMSALASNENFRHDMGVAARVRVESRFSEDRVTNEFLEYYKNLFSRVKVDF